MIMVRNRVGDDEPKAERSFTVRLSQTVMDEVNKTWKTRGFANRTELIDTACKTYFESSICPRCKTPNPPNGVKCSVCGETLHPYFKLRDDVIRLHGAFTETYVSLEANLETYDLNSKNLNEKIDKLRECGQITEIELSQYQIIIESLNSQKFKIDFEYKTKIDVLYYISHPELPCVIPLKNRPSDEEMMLQTTTRLIDIETNNGFFTYEAVSKIVDILHEVVDKLSFYNSHLTNMNTILDSISSLLSVRCGEHPNPPQSDSK